ncbi:hypothetical protein ACF0H5_013334 [Mactra antiquata]
MLSKTVLLGIFAIVLAYLYSHWRQLTLQSQDEVEQSIIDSWNASIFEPKSKFNRISVGINCNLDLIVSGTGLLSALDKRPGDPLDSVSLDNLDDLTNTFTHYFLKGAAAERTFTDQKIYKHIIDTAEKLPVKHHYVGGNAALIAVKVATLFPERKVQLVGPIGPGLLELLPSSIHIPENSRISDDEVHLIMEYGLDEKWHQVTSPVANRFITSFDESNGKLTMLGKFFSDLDEFNPDLVVISGLHLLDTQTTGFITSKLTEISEGLRNIPITIPVHLELASMANSDLMKQILKKVLPEVTSLGLNEQELSFSSYVAGGPHSGDFLTRTGQPEIHKISDMVLWILQEYGYSSKNPNSRLTRVHFHSLTYHIVGVVPGAWHNTESAVAAGTRMAGRQACDAQQLSPPDIELRIPQTFKLFSGDVDHHFDEKKPVLSWQRSGYHFSFSPVLVCISPLKTVGLGDAISATGLMFSEFDISYRT